eukprot:6507164-Prorocentrum_lima.AAC.1
MLDRPAVVWSPQQRTQVSRRPLALRGQSPIDLRRPQLVGLRLRPAAHLQTKDNYRNKSHC